MVLVHDDTVETEPLSVGELIDVAFVQVDAPTGSYSEFDSVTHAASCSRRNSRGGGKYGQGIK
jgi:hypothetical protein